jgi:hypothetical protein
MVHRDYRKEVGCICPKRTLPRAVSYAVLAGVAVVVTMSATHVLQAAAKRHAAKEPVAPAAAPIAPAGQ